MAPPPGLRAGSQALGGTARRFAVGVRPLSLQSSDGYGIALRIPSVAMLNSSVVKAMRQESNGALDIKVTGEVVARPAGAMTTYNSVGRHRPLRPGASVGHLTVTAGTLGCFVSVSGLSNPAILSNNHVLAATDTGVIGDAILQPGRYDGGVQGDDHVANLSDFMPIAGAPASYDVAVAELLHESFMGKNSFPDGPLYPPNGSDEDVARVAKWGRTTGHTLGVVSAIELDGLSVDFDGNYIRFNNVIEVEGIGPSAFSAGGDSGSVIYSAESRHAFALLFAGSTTGGSNGKGLTYAHPIQPALSAVNARIL